MLKKEILIKYCTGCKRYYSGRAMVASRLLNNVLLKHIKAIIQSKSPITLAVPHLRPTATGTMEEHQLTASWDGRSAVLPFKLELTMCQQCGREGTDYFESVLQLRNSDEATITAARDDILRNSKGRLLTKEALSPSGIDFYLSSQRATPFIAQRLQRRFGGMLKTTGHIHGRDHQKSKDIYRMTTVLTLPGFARGDVIVVKEKMYRVVRIGKAIVGYDLQHQKNGTIDLRSETPLVLPKHTAEITKTSPAVEILDPETYQPAAVKGQMNDAKKVGDKIDVVFYQGSWFIA